MLTRKELKQHAKEQLRGKATTGVLLTLVMFAICCRAEGLVLTAGGIGSILSQTVGIRAIIVVWILWALFAWNLSIGYMWAFLEVQRGQVPKVGRMFRPFRMFGKVAGIYVLIILILLAVYFVTAVAAGSADYFLHWTLGAAVGLAGIVLMIYLSLCFRMIPFLLYDQPEWGIRETIKQSAMLMREHMWELFVVDISFFWWRLLAIVTCGIAVFWVEPYINTTIANFYTVLIQEQRRSDQSIVEIL